MNITKEELQERAQLVRLHEANCHIEHPTADELNFRLAVMKRIGLGFALKEVRPLQIVGSATCVVTRPCAAKVR